MELDALMLSRIQFGFTMAFHIIFPVVGAHHPFAVAGVKVDRRVEGGGPVRRSGIGPQFGRPQRRPEIVAAFKAPR